MRTIVKDLEMMEITALYIEEAQEVAETRQLETKASSHEGQCIPAGYCHTNAHYAGGVNNYLNSNHTKYLAQLCGRFFAFLKISAANLRILCRHLPTELRNV